MISTEHNPAHGARRQAKDAAKGPPIPLPVRRAIAVLHRYGGAIHYVGGDLKVPLLPAGASPGAHAARDAVLAALPGLRFLVPSVTAEEAAQVHSLLAEAGACVSLIRQREAARTAVAALLVDAEQQRLESRTAVIGLDMETEVLPELRQPTPLLFNKDGSPSKQLPKEGAAGYALDPISSRVRLVQMWAGNTCFVFDMRAVQWDDFAPLFVDPGIAWAAFNAVFEAKRLLHERGAMPAGRMYDTMTAIWLTHGCRPGLEEAAEIVLGIEMPKALGASDWGADSLAPEQIEYAALDAVLAAALWAEQREALDELQEQAQELADGCIAAVARMELNGVQVDVQEHESLMHQWQHELDEARAARAAAVPGHDLDSRYGMQAHLQAALLEDSDDAYARWPRTKTGLLASDGAALRQAQHLRGIREHLAVAKRAKLISSFGSSLTARINPRTGRLHTNIRIAGASTGRFSSSGPNLQQLPKSKAPQFRRIVVAPPGRMLVGADYSQIELRAAAEVVHAVVGYSRMREGFMQGLDAHRTTAMHLAGKLDPAAVTEDERQNAKALNFGTTYGMSERGFFHYVRDMYQPDITEEEAGGLFRRFHNANPELSEWHRIWERETRNQGYVETPAGRRWYWCWRAKAAEDIDYDAPFIDDQISGYQRNLAFNHVIQGGCAEVMMETLRRLEIALRGLDARLLLTIHDEVLLDVRADPCLVRATAKILIDEMTAAFLHIFEGAPVDRLIEPTVGPNWGEMVPLSNWEWGPRF